MAESEPDKADELAEGLHLLIAEHSRQRYRMNAIEKVLAMMFQERAAAMPDSESPPLLRGRSVGEWIDLVYKREMETALRRYEDMNPALAAHLQQAIDSLHLPTDVPEADQSDDPRTQ